MKALIVSGRLVQDQELIYPYYRLQEAGFEVELAAEGPFSGILGVPFKPTIELRRLGSMYIERFQLLVIPGGVKCMEHLRLNEDVVKGVRYFHEHGGLIASICSGAQLLISAGLCKGRRISTYPAWAIDVENAGGTFVNEVCVDDRIVSAPHYRDLGPWMAATLKALGA